MENPFTIQQLQATYPYLNWLDYINWHLNDIMDVNESEVLNIPDKNYLQQLDVVLQSTPKRTIANYFAWRLVFFGCNLLDDVFHQRCQQYVSTRLGQPSSTPRVNKCVDLTKA